MIDEIFHTREMAKIFPDAPSIEPDRTIGRKLDPFRQAFVQ
jgi:hypothetical protein